MKVIRLCIQEFISGCLFCSIDWHICIYASQLPQWLSRWRICLQWRRHRRCRFNPWVKKIPWRRKWQPCPVFLPKKSPGQRSLGGLESKRSQKVKKTEQLSTQFLPNLHSSFLYLCSMFWNQRPPALLFFLRLLCLFGGLWDSMLTVVWIFYIWKKIHWNFNKNCIESLNCFG